MSVSFVTKSYRLETLIQELVEGRFVLPQFQRSFVWKVKDVKELLISLIQNVPIGIPIVVDSPSLGGSTPFGRTNLESVAALYSQLRKTPPCPDSIYLVIDGQQRLTSILYLFYCETIAGDTSLPSYMSSGVLGSKISTRPSLDPKYVPTIIPCRRDIGSSHTSTKFNHVFFIDHTVVDGLCERDEPPEKVAKEFDRLLESLDSRFIKAEKYSKGSSAKIKSYMRKKDEYFTVQELFDLYLLSSCNITTLKGYIKKVLSTTKKVISTKSANSCIDHYVEFLSLLMERLKDYRYQTLNYTYASSAMPTSLLSNFFLRLNRYGVVLTNFDLAVAYFYTKTGGKVDLRKELNGLKSHIKSSLAPLFVKEAVSKATGNEILRTMALIVGASVKKGRILDEIYDKIYVKPGPPPSMRPYFRVSDIKDLWDYAAKCYVAALFRLTEEYGVESEKMIPYTVMIPVLAAMLHFAAVYSEVLKLGSPPSPLTPAHLHHPAFSSTSSNSYIPPAPHSTALHPDPWEVIDCWYWCSVFAQRYTSNADVTSESDIAHYEKIISSMLIPSSSSTGTITASWCGGGAPIPINLRKATSSSAVYRGIMGLIVLNDRDFSEKHRCNTDWYKSGDPLVEEDHIFAKAILHGGGITKLADCILNRTLLSEKTNRSKLKTPTSHVLTAMESIWGSSLLDEVLKAHFIDENAKGAMKTNDFSAFIDAREIVLIDAINAHIRKVCAKLCVSKYPTFTRPESDKEEVEDEETENESEESTEFTGGPEN